MKLNEVFQPKNKPKEKKARAGVYPVYTDESGQTYVYMMVPSDPAYGGSKPQMGKGGIDKGETAEQAALREGHEELGLRLDNIDKVYLLKQEKITGLDAFYNLTVYVAEVKDKDNFDPHGYEASWTGWVEIEDAVQVSRTNQKHFVKMVAERYKNVQPIEEDVDQAEEKISAYETYAAELQAKLDKVLAALDGEQARGVTRDKDSLHKQRNVLKAKIQRAKSQIDLIQKHSVDPLPGEDNDPSLSMGGWAKSLAPVIKRIQSECKPYLEAIEYNVLEYRLYRGMQGTNAPYMSGRVRLTGRKPQATGTHVHDAVNEYFTENFGAPFRNALFTSSNPNFAADYGNLFIVFPTGKFKFIWSPNIEDLYNHEWALDEALDDDKADDDMPSDGNFFRATMDNYEYQNTDFIGAMESNQEIMIRTPVYYGINLSNFWHRNDEDDDSVGSSAEINQAMKIIQELLTDEDV